MSAPIDPELSIQSGFVSAVEEIYKAVENPDLWPSVLDSIADLIRGESTWLVANYANADLRDVRAFTRADPAALIKYQTDYHSCNVWAEPMDRMFGQAGVGYTHLAVPDAELKRSEFYEGWLKPNGVAYGLGMVIPLPGQLPALFTSLRRWESGPFAPPEGRILEALAPHLQRAIRLHFDLAGLRAAAEGLEAALDAFGRAVFGVDQRGQVLFCNQTARRLVTASDGLYILANQLRADSPEKDAELQFLFEQASIRQTRFSATGATLITRQSGKPSLLLTLMPVKGTLLGWIPNLATLVFVYDPASEPLERATVLRTLFRLSPSEARLADLLSEGLELSTAADHLRMSTQTARFHLKSIFRKTGVRRQTDLVRLALSLPSVSSDSE